MLLHMYSADYCTFFFCPFDKLRITSRYSRFESPSCYGTMGRYVSPDATGRKPLNSNMVQRNRSSSSKFQGHQLSLLYNDNSTSQDRTAYQLPLSILYLPPASDMNLSNSTQCPAEETACFSSITLAMSDASFVKCEESYETWIFRGT